MLKRLSVLLTLLSLVVAGGCGGDTDTTEPVATDDTTGEPDSADRLTKEEFIEQGDTICLALSLAGEEVEPPESPEGMPLYLTELVGQAEEAYRQFDLLEPPEDGEDVHQSLLEALSTSIATVEGAITAYENGDGVTGGDLLTQAADEGDEADEKLRAYGFQECGSESPVDEAEPPSDDEGSEPSE